MKKINGIKPLLNAILFQLVWFVCVLAGNVWAVVATLVFLVLHHVYFMHTRREWRLIVAFLALGVVIDGSLFQLGLFLPNVDTLVQADNSLTAWFPPVWLMCLWVSVATLFVHSLAFLRARYVLSALMGTTGPVLSYFAGANLAGIGLAEPVWLTLVVVAIVWALVLPLGFWLSEKWSLFDTSR